MGTTSLDREHRNEEVATSSALTKAPPEAMRDTLEPLATGNGDLGAPPLAIPHQSWKSMDLIYDLALREQEFQSKEWDEADGRLRLLLGFIGIIFAAALGVTGNLGTDLWAVRAVAGSGLLALLVSTVAAGVAYAPKTYHRPPSIRTLRQEFLMEEPANVKLKVVDNMLAAFDRNRATIGFKIRWSRVAQYSFVLSVLLLGAAILSRQILEIVR